MTIIIAVKDDERILIGADGQVIEGDTIVSKYSSKILTKKLTTESYSKLHYEEFLIGFSGVYSLFELLKRFEAPFKLDKDSFIEYLYKSFVPQLNNYLRDYNFIKEFNGQEGVDWELIIAYRNSLFRVEFNLGICEIETNYYAIGAPRDIALGSLWTNTHSTGYETNLEKKVIDAIMACSAHNVCCNDNMIIYEITEQGGINQIMEVLD